MAFLSTELLMALWLKVDVLIQERDQEEFLELEALGIPLIVKLIQRKMLLVLFLWRTRARILAEANSF